MTVRGWLCSSDPSPGQPGLAGAVTADAVDAAVAAGWLQQRPDSQVVEFAASHVLDVVRTAQGRELTPETVCAVRRAVLAAVEEAHSDHTWENLDPDVRESLLSCVVEGDLGTLAVVPAKLTAELFDLRRATGRDAAAGELLDAITERLSSGQAYPRVLTVATAEALFDAGRLDKAFQLLRDDYSRLQAQYGEDDARTRPALHNLAAAYAAAARAIRGQPESAPLYQDALTLFQKLLNARVKAVPVDSEQVIVTRGQYAQLLAECYHYQEALAQYQILLREQHAARGPDHPDTLRIRGILAYWRGEAGDPAGAAAAFEELLADRLRVLGPDHPPTLTTRNNLAYWRGEAGDPAGAAAAFEELLADLLRVLGPDHPLTLTARRRCLPARPGHAARGPGP
jgi:Tetratricopeptide repeat